MLGGNNLSAAIREDLMRLDNCEIDICAGNLQDGGSEADVNRSCSPPVFNHTAFLLWPALL